MEKPKLPDYSKFPEFVRAKISSWIYDEYDGWELEKARFPIIGGNDTSKQAIWDELLPQIIGWKNEYFRYLEHPWHKEEKLKKDIINLRERPFTQNGISYEQWLIGLAMQSLIPTWGTGNPEHYTNLAIQSKYIVKEIIEIQIEK